MFYSDRNPNRSVPTLSTLPDGTAYAKLEVDDAILIAQCRPNEWVGHLAKGDTKRQKGNF